MKRYSYIVLTALILASCSEKGLRTDSENAIRLTVDVPRTRATLFDGNASLLDKTIGGRDFRVSAYVAGGPNADKQYIADARVNYFEAADDWRFTPADSINYFDYYWPKNEKLNFFAYMPKDASEAAVTGYGYYTGGKPWFTFSLPLFAYDPEKQKEKPDTNVPASSPNQETLREFIYAYTPDQDKDTQDKNNGVKLQFLHPFAALYFDLGKSYRMELKSLTIIGLGFKGKYEYDSNKDLWFLTPENNTDSLYISVQKDVPSDELNFNSNIGGPYLVMPQATENLKLKIKYRKLDGIEYISEVNMSDAKVESWEAGKKYTYTLNLGDNKEEILFKVRVEEWDVVDYKNKIDVE